MSDLSKAEERAQFPPEIGTRVRSLLPFLSVEGVVTDYVLRGQHKDIVVSYPNADSSQTVTLSGFLGDYEVIIDERA